MQQSIISCECLLLKAAGNSDSQNTILETTKYSRSWGKKVVLYLLDKVWSQQPSNFQKWTDRGVGTGGVGGAQDPPIFLVGGKWGFYPPNNSGTNL